MFLKILFHDRIKPNKEGFNGHYLLTLTIGVEVGSFIPSTLPWVFLLLLGTLFGHEAHGWWRNGGSILDGDSDNIFIFGSFFFFLLFILFFFFFIVGDPLTNIGTIMVLEVL